MSEIPKNNTAETKLFAHDPVIELFVPDHRRVSLIYIDHGLTSFFPDQKLAEQEIKTAFGPRLSCLITDNFPGNRLPTTAEIKNLVTQPSENLNLKQWAIQFATNTQATVVEADPVNRSAIIKDFTDEEIYQELKKESQESKAYRTKRDEVISSNAYQELSIETGNYSQIEMGSGLLAPIAFIALLYQATHAYKEKIITRRQFLKISTTAALASIGLAINLTAASTVDANVKKLNDLIKQSAGDNPSIQQLIDYYHAQKFFSQNAEITDVDMADPSMVRRMAVVKRMIVSIGLRNAIIADTLTAPRQDITFQNGDSEPLNIAVLMGYSHRECPEEMTMGYFLKNRIERENLLHKLFTPINPLIPVTVELQNKLRQALRTVNAYKFFSDGEMQQKQFPLPFLR